MRKTGRYRLLADGIALLAVIALGAVAFTGCAKKEAKLPKAVLSVWGSESSVPLLEEGIEEFKKLHADEVDIEYTISKEGEDTCKEAILKDPEHAADLFMFPDDQFDELYQTGVLHEVEEHGDELLDAVGGKDTSIAEVVTRDGKVYAYPETAGNGYFLYYNKAYFDDSDLQTMDGLLKKAGKAGKKFTMDFANGWYIYSFFDAAGLKLQLNEDGKSNSCSWNAADTEYKGTDVVKAMLKIASDPAFISLDDEAFVKGVQNGSVIAGVNGPWNASNVEKAWGKDYGAVKLPTYTIKGKQLQMHSFAGYKLMGVSAHSKYPEWSMRLAEFLTNKENQLKRFKKIGECPVNVEAAGSKEVQAAPAVAALAEQSAYSNVQRVAEPFWNAAGKLGISIAGKNSDHRDLQELLDEMVEETEQTAKEQK